jgi:glycosyltransferase involved in cell wall biosynthesis
MPQALSSQSPQTAVASAFTIVHLGSLSERSRSSRYFLQACGSAFQAGQLPVDKVRIQFIGNIDRESGRLARQMGLEEYVQVLGYLPHREALERLTAADLLLLIPSYGEGAELFVPGKLYEYLASGRPILCLAEAGASADLITRSRSGWVVKPTDIGVIAGKLVELFRLWEQGGLITHPNRELIASFERRKLTERLTAMFDQVAGNV